MAILFNNAADIIMRTAAPMTATPLTLSGWFRMTNHADGLAHEILSILEGVADVDGFKLRIDATTGVARAVHRSTSTSSFSSSASAIPDENWHHVAGIFVSNSSRTVYLDGVAGTTNTTSRATPSCTRTLIGGEDSVGLLNNIGHELAELAAWNVVLDADEIAALAKGFSPKLIRRTALKFYAPLNRDLTETHDSTAWSTSTNSGVVAHPRVLAAAAALPGSLDYPIAGAASITEASDTSSATGALALAATAAITEASDTAAAAAALALAAAASITEASDTVSAAGALALAAAASITEASDAVSATGAVAIAATASITEASDTVTSAATAGLTAAASITEASDTVSSSATLALAASLSITEADDTLAAASALAIAAVAAIIEAGDILSAASTFGAAQATPADLGKDVAGKSAMGRVIGRSGPTFTSLGRRTI